MRKKVKRLSINPLLNLSKTKKRENPNNKHSVNLSQIHRFFFEKKIEKNENFPILFPLWPNWWNMFWIILKKRHKFIVD